MQHHEIIEQLRQNIQPQELHLIQAQLNQLQAADFADVLDHIPLQLACKLLVDAPNRAQIFEYTTPALQTELAQHIDQNILIEILTELPSDERTDVFKSLKKSQQKMLMPALAQAKREEIMRLVDYEEGTAGALMNAQYATLHAEMTVKQAIKNLRLEAPNAETIYVAYILDDQRHLLGIVTLKNLLLSEDHVRIKDLMRTQFLYAHVESDQDDVAKMISRYDLLALPIVDASEQMVGIVTYDDAMDVLDEEATEDFLKSSAVESSITSIKKAPLTVLYRKRVFWLVFLVFGSLLSGIGIAHFEDIIAAHIVLVFFLPLLVGSGGNAGSQSATLMVRALATGDVEFRDWFSLLGRESLVALMLGGTMACAVSLLGYFRGDHMVALVLALSMMGIVLMGCLIGMSLPFILNRLKLDPASASAPLVTSICDAMGVVVYLFIASQILTL